MAPGRYRSLSGSLVDLEKQRVSDTYNEDQFSSRSSSRSTSGSHIPMLGGKPKTGASYAYHLPRRRFTRYFTFSITAVLFIFFVYLIRASRTNAIELSQGLKKPPSPPPAYEQFPFLKRYHGGIRTLVDRDDNIAEYPADSEEIEVKKIQDAAMERKKAEDKAASKRKGKGKDKDKGLPKRELTISERAQRFNPLPDYTSQNYTDQFETPVHCYLDETAKLDVPQLLAYRGVSKGFPEPAMGSYDILGLRNDVCFERYGRLSPYGYGYSRKYGGSGAGMEGEKEGSEAVWGDQDEIDYTAVNWGQAQKRCIDANQHRFKAQPLAPSETFRSASVGSALDEQAAQHTNATEKDNSGKQLLSRTAVLIRTWTGYEYDEEDLFYLRAMINELSIQTGAEYMIHFLIHVKDNDVQIWSDEDTYQRVLNDSLPVEFQGMGTLWSERQMSLIYGGLEENEGSSLPLYGAYRSTFMPVQYFAHMHPEYDFFWHWEMDVRYTGHFYHLFTQVSEWAKEQPRKELWERNGRFYVPSEHGSWEDFRHMVRVQLQHGTDQHQNMYAKMGQDAASRHPLDKESRHPEQPIWGPLHPAGEGNATVSTDSDPQPKTTYEKDNYEWGVGEDADLITFNPLFDPHDTDWILAEDVTGYNLSEGFPPRRAAIITASRLSKRLLETMHRETSLKRHTMSSEMWPGSCALHHGYKAVYAPHPVYIDRAWPLSYLAAIFNNGRNGASGGARTSIFSDERQNNFLGTTWYYHAAFAPNLWKRWLGYKVDNDGGEEWELANEGRMCMPAMLLHPVKQVDLVYEHQAGES